jgi:hypothetical protein
MTENKRIVKETTVNVIAIRQALETLKTIDDYFKEGHDLNAEALLFEDEQTLREHVSQATKDLQGWCAYSNTKEQW